ncbi:MAG: alpha/beta fold hydrolase [Spirochaetales bacterium]|nr:alpha/beta fold hydrolase [Spirochaetales bacterium]
MIKKKIKAIYFCFLPLLFLDCCAGFENPDAPVKEPHEPGCFINVSDNSQLFVYSYQPEGEIRASIYILSGITGIDHYQEEDIISLLSAGGNRVVIIHPRGTGYSQGTRGDIKDFGRFLLDYEEVIQKDFFDANRHEKIILYGHSMSTAVALYVCRKLSRTDGIILINPPYKMKNSQGMTPSLWDYIIYGAYFIFAPHTPVVNMAGKPELIKNSEEREEAQKRNNNPLLVKYFSMYMMFESRKLMDNMLFYGEQANSPLLLIYGTADSIVDKSGCDALYEKWKQPLKKYILVEKGPHGKKTVKEAAVTIKSWIEELP